MLIREEILDNLSEEELNKFNIIKQKTFIELVKDDLQFLFVHLGMVDREIGSIFEVDKKTVQRKRLKYGVKYMDKVSASAMKNEKFQDAFNQALEQYCKDKEKEKEQNI